MALTFYPEGSKPIKDDNEIKSVHKWLGAGAPSFTPGANIVDEGGALLVGEQGEYIVEE